MSDFKAKTHQIRFRLGLRPRAFSAPADPLAGFKGPTSKSMGREGEWRGEGSGEGKGEEGRGEGREGERTGGRDGLQHRTPSGRPNPATPLSLCVIVSREQNISKSYERILMKFFWRAERRPRTNRSGSDFRNVFIVDGA